MSYVSMVGLMLERGELLSVRAASRPVPESTSASLSLGPALMPEVNRSIAEMKNPVVSLQPSDLFCATLVRVKSDERTIKSCCCLALRFGVPRTVWDLPIACSRFAGVQLDINQPAALSGASLPKRFSAEGPEQG